MNPIKHWWMPFSACCSADLHLCPGTDLQLWVLQRGLTLPRSFTSIKVCILKPVHLIKGVSHFNSHKHNTQAHTQKYILPYYNDNAVQATSAALWTYPEGRLFASEALCYFPAASLWGEDTELMSISQSQFPAHNAQWEYIFCSRECESLLSMKQYSWLANW